MKEMWKRYKRQIQIDRGNLFDCSIGDRRICSSESGYCCADKGRDKTRRQSPPIRRLRKRIRRIQLLIRKRVRNRITGKKGRNQV